MTRGYKNKMDKLRYQNDSLSWRVKYAIKLKLNTRLIGDSIKIWVLLPEHSLRFYLQGKIDFLSLLNDLCIWPKI